MQEAPALPSEIKSIVDQHAPLQCFIATQVNTITSLQSRVDFLQVEHDKLAKLLAAQIAGHRKETHISSELQGWLPFESQEEFDQARAVAEAEAQAIVDARDLAPPKPKKPRKESLPQHLPVVDRVFDVPEDKRVCPTHGPMTCMGCDETGTAGNKDCLVLDHGAQSRMSEGSSGTIASTRPTRTALHAVGS